MSQISFNYSEAFETTTEIANIAIGNSNKDQIFNNEYLITNLTPGKSYSLKTSVYNRGDSLVHERTSIFWPVDNISDKTYELDDFISNINCVLDPDTNILTCNISELVFEGDVKYKFHFENASNNIYKQHQVTSSSSDISLFEINIVSDEMFVFDAYYSVIVENLYVVSHRHIDL